MKIQIKLIVLALIIFHVTLLAACGGGETTGPVADSDKVGMWYNGKHCTRPRLL